MEFLPFGSSSLEVFALGDPYYLAGKATLVVGNSQVVHSGRCTNESMRRYAAPSKVRLELAIGTDVPQ